MEMQKLRTMMKKRLEFISAFIVFLAIFLLLQENFEEIL